MPSGENLQHHHAGASLSAYFDGELSPEVARAMSEHLAGCEQCRGELEELIELSRQVRHGSKPRPAMSQIEKARVVQNVNANLRQQDMLLRTAVWLTRFAAVLLIGSGLAVFFADASFNFPPQPASWRSPARNIAQAPAWEQLAAEPSQALAMDNRSLAGMGLAEWMVSDLSRAPAGGGGAAGRAR